MTDEFISLHHDIQTFRKNICDFEKKESATFLGVQAS